MAELGKGEGTGLSQVPRVQDTAQVYRNSPTTAPDSNTRMDAELANDVLAAVIELEKMAIAAESTPGNLATLQAEVDAVELDLASRAVITSVADGLQISSGVLRVKYFVDPSLHISLAAADTAAVSSGGVILIDTPFTTPTTTFAAPVLVTGWGRFTKGSGILTFNGGLQVLPVTRQVFFGYSPGDILFGRGTLEYPYPQWWGAKGDWNGSTGTDNYSIIMCAVTSMPYASEVPIINGNFAYTRSIVSRDGTVLVGQGTAASTLTYTGTDFAVNFGNYDQSLLFAGHREGLGVRHLRINLNSALADGAVALYGTKGANVDDLYIEGIPSTTTSYAVVIDRGHATGASILNNLTKVRSAHTAHGFAALATVTSLKLDGCSAICDGTVGSNGFYFGVTAGQGSSINGGNAESCYNGIKIEGQGITVSALRFEGNSNSDLFLDTTSEDCHVEGCINLNSVTENSTNPNTTFSGNPGYPDRGSRGTTTKRNSLPASNGMTWYNTTTQKAQVYENGAWVNLI